MSFPTYHLSQSAPGKRVRNTMPGVNVINQQTPPHSTGLDTSPPSVDPGSICNIRSGNHSSISHRPRQYTPDIDWALSGRYLTGTFGLRGGPNSRIQRVNTGPVIPGADILQASDVGFGQISSNCSYLQPRDLLAHTASPPGADFVKDPGIKMPSSLADQYCRVQPNPASELPQLIPASWRSQDMALQLPQIMQMSPSSQLNSTPALAAMSPSDIFAIAGNGQSPALPPVEAQVPFTQNDEYVPSSPSYGSPAGSSTPRPVSSSASTSSSQSDAHGHGSQSYRRPRRPRSVCPSCRSSFGWPSKLRSHQMSVHPDKYTFYLMCPGCDYTTTRKDNLARHFGICSPCYEFFQEVNGL
ncbi:hypothetical protein PG993_015120 [Apiospora rasikravindrae]|uniref:C2H2-type domain-containing protein n=1 Tax=Apiospora rasikravindrae TaxID=990691 RepID=A0ABR1RPP0_9PEZI